MAHVGTDTTFSVESVLIAGNMKTTDLLCVTPRPIPHGAHAMTQLVELPPADAEVASHRHSGPVFGYVLEGTTLFELEREAPREIVAGEAFWEPGGDVVANARSLIDELFSQQRTSRMRWPTTCR